MKKLVYIFMAIVFVSCGGKRTTSTKKTSDSTTVANVDTIAQVKPEEKKDTPIVLYDYNLGKGKHRIFYQVKRDSGGYYICTRVTKKSAKELKPTIIPFEKYEKHFVCEDGTAYPFFYRASPDGQYFYAIEDIMTSGLETYELYRINCRTLQVKFITDCCAIKATKMGFTVVQARLTNYETATSNLDYIYAMYDEYYNWNGYLVSKSIKEYDDEERNNRFLWKGDHRALVRNFNIKIPSSEQW